MISGPADYNKADIEMLLWLCRRELGSADASDDKAIGDHCWRGILAAASDHGLISPLQSAVSRSPAVPEQVLTSVRTAFLAQAARNFQLTAALLEILRCF